MSLPKPARRRPLHTRTIKCEGFEREDGLYDIEARIIDQKAYDVEEPYRGHRSAGTHVHDMEVRLTLDADKVVRAIEVFTNDAPYQPCHTTAPGYQRLVGAQIGAGWRKAVAEAVGRTKGCTHITELLMPMATVAFQTMSSWRSGSKFASEAEPDTSPERPHFLGGCKAWAEDGPVVKKLFPLHYRGRD